MKYGLVLFVLLYGEVVFLVYFGVFSRIARRTRGGFSSSRGLCDLEGI